MTNRELLEKYGMKIILDPDDEKMKIEFEFKGMTVHADLPQNDGFSPVTYNSLAEQIVAAADVFDPATSSDVARYRDSAIGPVVMQGAHELKKNLDIVADYIAEEHGIKRAEPVQKQGQDWTQDPRVNLGEPVVTEDFDEPLDEDEDYSFEDIQAVLREDYSFTDIQDVLEEDMEQEIAEDQQTKEYVSRSREELANDLSHAKFDDGLSGFAHYAAEEYGVDVNLAQKYMDVCKAQGKSEMDVIDWIDTRFYRGSSIEAIDKSMDIRSTVYEHRQERNAARAERAAERKEKLDQLKEKVVEKASDIASWAKSGMQDAYNELQDINQEAQEIADDAIDQFTKTGTSLWNQLVENIKPRIAYQSVDNAVKAALIKEGFYFKKSPFEVIRSTVHHRIKGSAPIRAIAGGTIASFKGNAFRGVKLDIPETRMDGSYDPLLPAKAVINLADSFDPDLAYAKDSKNPYASIKTYRLIVDNLNVVADRLSKKYHIERTPHLLDLNTPVKDWLEKTHPEQDRLLQNFDPNVTFADIANMTDEFEIAKVLTGDRLSDAVTLRDKVPDVLRDVMWSAATRDAREQLKDKDRFHDGADIKQEMKELKNDLRKQRKNSERGR